MGFHEVQFPTDLKFGSAGGPGYNTNIIETDSGAEERVARWDGARRRFNAAYNVKTLELLSTVQTFYIARSGPAYGFRFKDWLDYSTNSDDRSAPTPTDVQIGTGDGSETQFQLIKKYTSGSTTKTRNINKPVIATTRVAIDGVEQLLGWSVDTTTGIITFSVAPALNAIITAGCQFDVPVRFGREVDELLSFEIAQKDFGNLPDIPLIEIIDPEPVSDEFLFRGSAEVSLTANASITELTGFAIAVTATVGPHKYSMPDPSAMSLGGPYFHIENVGSNSFNICDEGENVLFALGAGESCLMSIFLISSTNTWKGLK